MSTGVNVNAGEDKPGDVLIDFKAKDRKKGLLRPGDLPEGIISRASSSGPDLSRIFPGISVSIELIQASSLSLEFCKGELGRPLAAFLLLENIPRRPAVFRCRTFAGVDPGLRSE